MNIPGAIGTGAYPAQSRRVRDVFGPLTLFVAEVALLLVGGLALIATRPGVPQGSDTPPQVSAESKPRPMGQRSTTSIVLIVDSEEAGETYRALFAPRNLLGQRGDIEVSVVVILDDRVLADLTAMVVGNDRMCPGQSCGQALVVDLRTR